MANICSQMINAATDVFLDFNVEKAVAVWHRDNEIDRKFAIMMTLVRNRMQDKEDDNIETCTQVIGAPGKFSAFF